ncbi:SDR family NAD(P)-dependent oxidoreductase [Tsukamurella sp. 8F]|uniref:SDR family NAD(P)-dependent oxidoreductase n=1 Tax=unclassified Tsukamurella TaxID=2633480 RepID=UPI0023B956C6|nr:MULTISPECIES: SDR family NAD(P)-dependent oxidoreductase [unclassified Tsukamurella]MDF0531791.1 SDR family NAD(P)-dependent oxidoreductase [Tsukamurella sp. 8J]MDF0589033.1 SDR family NAD(P)-dependent oxidoreductase [Tsukamurella sp. 8F]
MSLRKSIQNVVQRRTLLPGPLDAALSGTGRDVAGLTVVVTGASAGIGHEATRQLTARGATVIGVARREAALRELSDETGCRWLTCDLMDTAAIDGLLGELGGEPVDVLVNNAGHSIRRSIVDSTDRLHDYQRTMQLNYFAAVQLSLGLLPAMRDRGDGQIVNVCTWALHANTFPRFSAYAASKSALAIFGRTLNAERAGVRATNVYFPLVRTEMIAPTAEYDSVGALSPVEAGDWILRAITHRPVEVSPAVLRALLPAIDLLSPPAADRTIASIT